MIGLQNPYYFVHAFHNFLVLYETWDDVVTTYTHFDQLSTFQPNTRIASIVMALHVYHCILYWERLRQDDWIHHILMVGVALPIGMLLPSSTLLGYSLFFTTGLPGCIDYFFLFLVRNGFMARLTEKQMNYVLNVWIRSPGCISHAALTLVYCMSLWDTIAFWKMGLMLLPPVLTYWNGQYFMAQVVADLAFIEATQGLVY